SAKSLGRLLDAAQGIDCSGYRVKRISDSYLDTASSAFPRCWRPCWRVAIRAARLLCRAPVIPARTNRSLNLYRRLRAAHHQLLSNGTKAQIASDAIEAPYPRNGTGGRGDHCVSADLRR